MNLEWSDAIAFLKDVWWVLSVPMGAVGLFGMFYLRSQFPTRSQHDALGEKLGEAIADLGERVASGERQVARLEGDLRQLPTRQEVAALGERIGRVEKEVATSTETTRGVSAMVTKIDATLSLILKHMLDSKEPKA